MIGTALFLVASWVDPCRAWTPSVGSVGTTSAQHAGRAGVYYRVTKHDRGLNFDHPLVDAVVLSVPWARIEPRKGEFQFEELRRAIAAWAEAGKGVVINTPLYGQAPDDSITPPWIYEQGAHRISFRGGGRAKGREISIPAVWERGFVEEFLAPLVSALAAELDGNPHVRYLMPAFGHIGNINTQPSKNGAAAVRSHGWTPEKWKLYVDRVVALYRQKAPDIPLISKSAPMLLRDRHASNYSKQADEILSAIGERGVAVISLGLSSSMGRINQVHRRVALLSTSARRGATRVGVGDDWPLWVPEERRRRGSTLGRDEKSLEQMLRLVFGGIDGMPEVPVTILFCQEPEISASNPNHPMYRERVYEAIRGMRRRLHANDALIYLQADTNDGFN